VASEASAAGVKTGEQWFKHDSGVVDNIGNIVSCGYYISKVAP